jgi:hypothetical protein
VNALLAVDEDIALETMDPKELQADNIAKGIIVGHVNNLMMLTLTMLERAYDMYAYMKDSEPYLSFLVHSFIH